MTHYAVGCDLGQAHDPTVVVIVRYIEPPKAEQPAVIMYDLYGRRQTPYPKTIPPSYEVVHVEAVPLGTEYPEIAETLAELMGMPELGKDPDLVIDATGLGRPVVDMIRGQLKHGHMRCVTLTAGAGDHYESPMYYVPKVNVIAEAQVVLQQHRIEFVDIPQTDVLIEELRTFRVAISANGHETYNAAQGAHDDHVIALALGVWWFERHGPHHRGIWIMAVFLLILLKGVSV